ncbi:MAG: hydantoinase/oxoprolinase family protein [Methanothrix sp.]|uniref:Hydantoinase/oxoprolinase n=2 Tax=Methanothrix TaxID=2222 RepID=A0B905_METTP|nr:Hydantoinase/oxoprolinase [Methanothrix thermoacetophila PT]MBC7079237.1 hydantoinase/oxoprolinase family protein [Methanothrix sp.]NPU86701.1 hydantoinase/oxoprolinase family protein [Methanothrix sp.]
MFVGIDVGGTTTNAALVDGNKVVKTAIGPTDHQEILGSLLRTMDRLIEGVDVERIERVVLSTTLITNLIAEGKADKVGLVLIPGPGVNPRDYRFRTEPVILDGAIDYRGREIAPLRDDQIRAAAQSLADQGYRKVAVVGKFCQRNHEHETHVREIFSKVAPAIEVEMGHRVSGQLNFPRRAATTMLTLATRDHYRRFAEQAERAMRDRGIRAPIYILKADGGTLPLDKSLDKPVETIFSGPAASVMGVMALTPKGQTSVVVDIGGTTTDLALILSGKPLLSSKGAKIEDMLTHVRAFAVRSIGIGGDSVVRVSDGKITVGPDRAGPAFALGGPEPTPTDALMVLGHTNLGDVALARKGIGIIAKILRCSTEDAARMIVDTVVERIVDTVNMMFLEWEQEPAYRIWELLQRTKARPQNVVGVGGASPPLVPLVAKRLNANAIIPEHAPVANAIGAAVARPTMTLSLRIDTERGMYTVEEDGTLGEAKGRNLSLEGAQEMARRLLRERAERFGIHEYADEAEVVDSEIFNMVRGWSTVGKLIDVRMEIPAGIITSWRRDHGS